MNDKEKNEKITEFMRKPGYQLDYRRALYTAHKLKSLNSDERKAELTKFVSESSFLLRRTTDPAFYRFVKREMMKNGWYWRQVKLVGHLILVDILHPKNATPTRAAKKPKISDGFSDGWVTDRQLYRIRKENYPEIFFTPSQKGNKPKDKRFIRYSTIFSDLSGVSDEEWDLAIQILAAQDLARLAYLEDINTVRSIHAHLRLVDPDDVFCLHKFWEYQNESLRIITANFGPAPNETSWLKEHIKTGTAVLERIYQLIDDAIALRWYQTIKSENKKELLLRKNVPFRYSKEDAQQAVKENLRWFKDPVLVADYVFRGIFAFNQIGKHKVAIYLLKECLKQVPLKKLDKGLCYNNIAVTYKFMQKPRKCLIWLKKALNTFKELNDSLQVGMTWAGIAETYYLLNRPDKCENAKNQSKEVLANSKLNNRQQMEAYLYLADCAYQIKDRKWEQEAVVLALEAASEIEDPQYFLYFNQRLMDLETGMDTSKMEQEPGRVERPPMFPWYKEGSEMFRPLSPRSTNLESDEKKSSDN